MKEADISLSNQFAYSYIYSQAGLILFTLKSEVSNGAMKSILKKRRRKKIDSLFVNYFFFIFNYFKEFCLLLLLVLIFSKYLTFFENFNLIKNVDLE